jgi:glutamate synthase (NADPH/NADH) small chain
MQLRTSTSHEEGCDRQWEITTTEFIGDANGNVKGLKIADMHWSTPAAGEKPQWVMKPGSEREIPCDLALLAIGFMHPQKQGLIEQLGCELDKMGNVQADSSYKTSVDKVFAAGDMRRGQSLVVWAISEGRECAANIDIFLQGKTTLDRKDQGSHQVAFS